MPMTLGSAAAATIVVTPAHANGRDRSNSRRVSTAALPGILFPSAVKLECLVIWLASKPRCGAKAAANHRELPAMQRVIVAFLAIAGVCVANVATAQERSRLDDVIRAGKLRICTPGDYKPFSLAKTDGSYEGLDIDLMRSAAKSLGVQPEFVKTSWPKLMDDFVEKCDIAVGGISVTTERAKRAAFSAAYMVNGKAPITRCENVAKYQTVADINKPTVTVITNPGGSNERFVRTNLPQAKVVVFNDNVTIFDEILKGH